MRLLLVMFSHHSNIYRALAVNPGSEVVRDAQRIYARELEVPAGGGVGTARAIARAYSVFATGGRELKLRPETLRALAAPAIPSANGFHDDCLLAADVRYSLGFTKPSSFWPFGGEGSYGSLGAGGSMGFADPAAGSGTRTSPARWAARCGATRATSRCVTRSTRPSPCAERCSLAAARELDKRPIGRYVSGHATR